MAFRKQKPRSKAGPRLFIVNDEGAATAAMVGDLGSFTKLIGAEAAADGVECGGSAPAGEHIATVRVDIKAGLEFAVGDDCGGELLVEFVLALFLELQPPAADEMGGSVVLVQNAWDDVSVELIEIFLRFSH